MLEEYRKHVAERAAQGIVPKPLDATQMAALVELLKTPPVGEEEFLLDLLINRVPPGVDEAAYVKAGFLAAVAKGDTTSPLVTPEKAIELLSTMQGGYNIHPLIDALDDAKLAPIAAKALSSTLLMFDNFYDVEEKAKAGNEYAKQVMQSWADAEWFLNRPQLAEKITVTVFKVTGETNTDDLSPAPDAWSRPDIPLHALAMLKNAREGIDPDQPGSVGPIKQIEALQKQILKEKEEEEARRKAEEQRRAARRIQISDEDYQILLRIVQAEAGICDDKGKILVADVIINRVLSKRFPNTVKGVVYQRSQFQPVSNGRINSVKVTPDTIRCVDRALDGEDYSNGALYFMNRQASGRQASWFDSSLTYLFAHGGHEFFK